MSHPYLSESIWTDKPRADDAERLYQEHLLGSSKANNACCTKTSNNVSAKPSSTSSLVDEIARARQQIKNSLQSAINISTPSGNESALAARVDTLEKQNKDLKNVVGELQKSLSKLEARLSSLEGGIAKTPSKPIENGIPAKPKKPAEPVSSKDDDDDVDLFGSEEEEDADAAKLREKRLEEYAAKKSKKTAVIAKSNVILDVKPWDDETDMAEMEKQVRTIQCDGLLWGISKLVPLAYGIKKLQIVCVVEDEKVSIDWLTEEIQSFEDYVQSVDIAAFQKI